MRLYKSITSSLLLDGGFTPVFQEAILSNVGMNFLVNKSLCTSWNHSLGKSPEAGLLGQRLWTLLSLLMSIENLVLKRVMPPA